MVAILRDIDHRFHPLIMFRLLRIELTEVKGARELNTFLGKALIAQAVAV